MDETTNELFDELYEVIYVNQENIFHQLAKFRPSNDNLLRYEVDGKDGTTLDNSLKLIADSCQTVIVEKRYIDKDYRDEYSNFYSKTFQPYKNYCQRLHFFSVYIDKKEILKTETYKSDYLGFIILRPLEIFKVGRTILKMRPYENHYITCHNTWSGHLFGDNFQVEGTPFMQQDARVGLCAQASLWMAVNAMSKKDGGKGFRPFEITQFATSHMRYGSIVPSQGLTSEQISDALLGMGYTPLFLLKSEVEHKQFKPLKHIYPYIESGIPVILGISRREENKAVDHAVIVIGHTLDFSTKLKKPLKDKLFCHLNRNDYYCSSEWVDNLIIHDDAKGPYETISIKNPVKNNFSLEDIQSIIIPQPEKTFLPSHLAEAIASSFLSDSKLWEIAVEEPNKAFDEFKEHKDSKNVCLRTYLILGVDFKKQIKSSNKINPIVKENYQLMNMSKYVWVTEITTPDLYSSTKGRRRIGEIVIDYTSYHEEFSFLAIHVPGVFIVRDPYEENIDITMFQIDKEEPYDVNESEE